MNVAPGQQGQPMLAKYVQGGQKVFRAPTSADLLRGQTHTMVEVAQARAGSQWQCDLIMGAALSIVANYNFYTYFSTEQYYECGHDLAMWKLVDGLNLLPAVFLYMWGAYAKYRLRSDQVYLTDSKHAQVDSDQEAATRVLTRNVAFLSMERIRLGGVLICIAGWIAWDVLGWYWWSNRGTCDPRLARSTQWSFILGWVLFPLLFVRILYLLMTMEPPENIGVESGSESA